MFGCWSLCVDRDQGGGEATDGRGVWGRFATECLVQQVAVYSILSFKSAQMRQVRSGHGHDTCRTKLIQVADSLSMRRAVLFELEGKGCSGGV
jgi:hypothetical protein